MILTVTGRAAVFQRLLDVTAQADVNEGIRQGLEDVEKGRVAPAREALAAFRRRHGIPLTGSRETED